MSPAAAPVAAPSSAPSSAPTRLGRSFFAQPTLWVAPRLLGRLLVFEGAAGPVGGRIVEVEAYVGTDDPACHAASGRTARNETMWGPPGRAYVYFTYGMHHCLNVVTEREGFPAAVLVRALEPTVGLAAIARRQSHLVSALRLSGPGRVCAGLGLDRRHDGLDLTAGRLWIGRGRPRTLEVRHSTRVGIRRGRERMWRFFLPGHPAVSAARQFPHDLD